MKPFFSSFQLLFPKSKITASAFVLTQKQYDDLQHVYSTIKIEPTKNCSPLIITGNDIDIVKSIRTTSAHRNLNNITRTEAYWEFFVRNPEIHWAFLAHLVSRNGGYHMTDLKGELTGEFLPPSKQQAFFHFFERANALIFHDAFPQLLLYEKSKQQKRNLFHLLPAFSISKFMSVMWNHYWQHQNAHLLALSLIINEQHYIEQRLISSSYSKNVLNTWQYALQNVFGFTQVILPYYEQENIRLSGTSVQYFESISKRIEIGQQLYSLLFGNDSIKRKAVEFAKQHPHTGSRMDYAPSCFTLKKERIRKIYSPPLHLAWEEVNHTFLDRSDWFCRYPIQKNWFTIPSVTKTDITDEHFKGLQSLLLIKDHFSPLLSF